MSDRYLQYNPWRARIVLLALLLLVMACAQVGIPTAQTFNEKLSAGYALNAGLRQTATDLLTAKKISVDDAQNVLASTDAARIGLDVARNLSKTDMNAAEGKLAAVHTGLVALQTYLAGRK